MDPLQGEITSRIFANTAEKIVKISSESLIPFHYISVLNYNEFLKFTHQTLEK